MKVLINLDNCLPDYFNGHHNRVFVAYYDKNTTVGDILEKIDLDSNNQDITREFCGFSLCEYKRAYKKLLADNADNLDTIYMPDCEFEFDELEDCYDSPVAYFTLIDENTGE